MPTTRSSRSPAAAAKARDELRALPVAAAAPAATEARDKYALHGQLGHSGKDKAVFRATCRVTHESVAVACYHKTKGKSIQVEAQQQRRASAVGVAPQLLEVDLRQRRLVMELMPGGTLIDVAKRQKGLTTSQQQRIIQLLRCLGAPEAAGGAGLRHGDCGNPANYVTSADGTLFLIDFAPPHCRDMPSAWPDDANLGSLGMLLWHPERGLLRNGWLVEPPLLLLREYRLFCRRSGMSDPMDSEPCNLPPALPPATLSATCGNLDPATPAARSQRRRIGASAVVSRPAEGGKSSDKQQAKDANCLKQANLLVSPWMLSCVLLCSVVVIAAGTACLAQHEQGSLQEYVPGRLPGPRATIIH